MLFQGIFKNSDAKPQIKKKSIPSNVLGFQYMVTYNSLYFVTEIQGLN